MLKLILWRLISNLLIQISLVDRNDLVSKVFENLFLRHLFEVVRGDHEPLFEEVGDERFLGVNDRGVGVIWGLSHRGLKWHFFVFKSVLGQNSF